MEVLKQSALPTGHSLDQHHSTGGTMRILERDNFLASQRGPRPRLVRELGPAEKDTLEQGTIESNKRGSEDSLRSAHSQGPRAPEPEAASSPLKKTVGRAVLSSNSKEPAGKEHVDAVTGFPRI